MLILSSLIMDIWGSSIMLQHLCKQAVPVFTFANQAGLDMLETTLVSLQDITLEKIFDDNGRKTLFSVFPQILQQVCCFYLQLLITVASI